MTLDEINHDILTFYCNLNRHCQILWTLGPVPLLEYNISTGCLPCLDQQLQELSSTALCCYESPYQQWVDRDEEEQTYLLITADPVFLSLWKIRAKWRQFSIINYTYVMFLFKHTDLIIYKNFNCFILIIPINFCNLIFFFKTNFRIHSLKLNCNFKIMKFYQWKKSHRIVSSFVGILFIVLGKFRIFQLNL